MSGPEFFDRLKHAVIPFTAIGAAAAMATGFVAPEKIANSMRNGSGLENPLKNSAGNYIPCGGPSAIYDPDVHEYILACASDFGQNEPSPNGTFHKGDGALPIYSSKDLVHWRFRAYTFPDGSHPPYGLSTTGNGKGGRYWAPELDFINRWVYEYFPARMNAKAVNRDFHTHFSTKKDTMAIFVARTKNPFGRHWQSKLLHYGGQFNYIAGNSKEAPGIIDPTVARDPKNHELYMAWTEQPRTIMMGRLVTNGFSMKDQVHKVLGVTQPWECSPAPKNHKYNSRGCVIEGPSLISSHSGHNMYLLVNAASTFNGSYKVGVARQTGMNRDGFPKFKLYPRPILRSGNGLYGPGIGGKPVEGPNKDTYMPVQLQLTPRDTLVTRYLGLTTFSLGSKLNHLAKTADTHAENAPGSLIPQMDGPNGQVRQYIPTP